MSTMEFSGKIWKWVCLVAVAISVAVTVGLGIKEHRTVREFQQERIELQDSIISLREDLVSREEAAVQAREALSGVRDSHLIAIQSLREELAKVRRSYRRQVSELSNLDTSELKSYFADRYQEQVDSTGQDSAKFLMTVSTGNQIRNDLVDLEFCKEESEIKDSLLSGQGRYIEDLTEQVQDLRVQRGYYANRADSFEQQFNVSEQVRNNLQKSLDKQQTLSCVLGGTAAVLVIGIVGNLLLSK